MREYKNLPATFNDRIHAFSIDYGLVVLIMLIMIFMQIHPVYGAYIKIAVTFVSWYLINVSPSFFKPGSSLGKKNSEVIVLTNDYNEVSIGTMHLREFFILICTLATGGIYVFVSFILLEKRIDKRAIHDLVFNTRVVREKPFIGLSE